MCGVAHVLAPGELFSKCLNVTPNPRLGSLLGVQPPTFERCSVANGNSTATRSKGPRSLSSRTDDDMILLLLMLGFYVRNPLAAQEAVICALDPPTRA